MQAPCSTSDPEITTISLPRVHPMSAVEAIRESSLTVLQDRDEKPNTLRNCHAENESTHRTSQPQKSQVSDHIASSTSLKKCRINTRDHQGSAARNIQNSSSWNNYNKICSYSVQDSTSELLVTFEKMMSKLCFSEGLKQSEEDYAVEVTKIYSMLSNKTGMKYAMLKDVILDQLLTGISTSKKERVMRISVSILTTIASSNKSVIEDIKKKGLHLCDLAIALKQNVHEAAILIYLVKPSPVEIKKLDILPALVEVLCNSGIYKGRTASLLLTPPGASLMIIEVLVTAFDYTVNSEHLAAINSPRVLCGLLDLARTNNLDELTSLATILIKWMQFDGHCRKYISQCTPVAQFILLLQSNKKRAKLVGLEYFHEVLRIPRYEKMPLIHHFTHYFIFTLKYWRIMK